MLRGFLATMGTLTSAGPHPPTSSVSPSSLPDGGRYPTAGPGPLVKQCPALLLLSTRRPRPVPASSPCLSRLTFRPFRLQPPHRHFATVALTRYVTAVACRVYPPGRPLRSKGMPSHGQGFGHRKEPPRQAWPNRVHLRYGLVVRLRLLPTSPHGDAVTTFDYRPRTLAWEGTCTLLIKRLHRRTRLSLRESSGEFTLLSRSERRHTTETTLGVSITARL
jgi:hypothetical protein